MQRIAVAARHSKLCKRATAYVTPTAPAPGSGRVLAPAKDASWPCALGQQPGRWHKGHHVDYAAPVGKQRQRGCGSAQHVARVTLTHSHTHTHTQKHITHTSHTHTHSTHTHDTHALSKDRRLYRQTTRRWAQPRPRWAQRCSNSSLQPAAAATVQCSRETRRAQRCGYCIPCCMATRQATASMYQRSEVPGPTVSTSTRSSSAT